MSESEQTTKTNNGLASRRSIVLDFLGSMNLAITIFVIIAIASAIGTVLKQNENYLDYIIKFGPFWHEFFLSLNLYDIYSAGWFAFLLAFLMISTSVCIYRNTPHMLLEMRNFRLNSKIKSIKLINGSRTWPLDGDAEQATKNITQLFRVQGYKTKSKQHDDRVIVAAMRGRWNRLGYILGHLGMIVVPLGFIIDSTMDIAFLEWSGKRAIDKESVYVKDMPKESQLQPDTLLSFRGNVSISEGQKSNFTLLRIRDGSMVQYLPFAIELKDFRVEHYDSGAPKSFESDLIIIDKEKDKRFEQTISVNHPLYYRGYTIYQASFGDGGSKLNLKVWPFYDYKKQTLEVDTFVRGNRVLDTSAGQLTLEIIDFKKYNVRPAQVGDPEGKKFVNDGSSYVFKVRDKSGQAREYNNYMSPVNQDGRYMFISGMRTNPSESYRFLHIPADDQFTVERFMNFHALLNNTERVHAIATSTVSTTLKNAPDSEKYKANIIKTMMELLDRFNIGGFDAIKEHIDRAEVSSEQKDKMADAYQKVLNTLLQAVYMDVLQQEGVDSSKPISEAQERFYFDALATLGGLHRYGTPFYAQLTDFTHVESSGLSIARLPGKNVFYFGSLMTIIGIFLLLYVNQQRLWAVIYKDESGQQTLVFAGSGSRNTEDFRRHYQQLVEKLERVLGLSK